MQPGRVLGPASSIHVVWLQIRAAFEQLGSVGRISDAQSADAGADSGGFRFAHPPYKTDSIGTDTALGTSETGGH